MAKSKEEQVIVTPIFVAHAGTGMAGSFPVQMFVAGMEQEEVAQKVAAALGGFVSLPMLSGSDRKKSVPMILNTAYVIYISETIDLSDALDAAKEEEEGVRMKDSERDRPLIPYPSNPNAKKMN